jgi:hypothetical protein
MVLLAYFKKINENVHQFSYSIMKGELLENHVLFINIHRKKVYNSINQEIKFDQLEESVRDTIKKEYPHNKF